VKMKGQIFIILTIIVVTILVLIKTSLNFEGLIRNKVELENSLEREIFSSLKKELNKVLISSYNETSALINNENDFLSFSRSVLKSRLLDLKCLAIYAFYEKINASEPTTLNLIFFNMLGKVQQLNFTFNFQTKNFSNLELYEKNSTSFQILITSDQELPLEISYEFQNEIFTYSFSIPFEVNRSKFITFFDLSLEGKMFQNDKVIYTIDLI